MFTQYIKFMINGGILGIVALMMQSLLFQMFGQGSGFGYAFTSAVTYAFILTLNFTIQRALIFTSQGRFERFIVAHLLIMVLVSVLAPICRSVVGAAFGLSAGNSFGFIIAALLGATPSFLLSRYWIFNPDK